MWPGNKAREGLSHPTCAVAQSVDLETARYDIHTRWMATVICFVWAPGKPEQVHVEEYLYEHDCHQNVTNHSTALGHRTC